jgi:hypothetical protein
MWRAQGESNPCFRRERAKSRIANRCGSVADPPVSANASGKQPSQARAKTKWVPMGTGPRSLPRRLVPLLSGGSIPANAYGFAPGPSAILTSRAAALIGEVACSVQDIEVRQETERFIVGELYNGCSDAVGARVKLQAVFRDKTGQVVIVREFWPASTRNVAAKNTYAFSNFDVGDPPVATMSST